MDAEGALLSSEITTSSELEHPFEGLVAVSWYVPGAEMVGDKVVAPPIFIPAGPVQIHWAPADAVPLRFRLVI